MKTYWEESFPSKWIAASLACQRQVNLCSLLLSVHPHGELAELKNGRSTLGWYERLACLVANEELCWVMNVKGGKHGILDTDLFWQLCINSMHGHSHLRSLNLAQAEREPMAGDRRETNRK